MSSTSSKHFGRAQILQTSTMRGKSSSWPCLRLFCRNAFQSPHTRAKITDSFRISMCYFSLFVSLPLLYNSLSKIANFHNLRRCFYDDLLLRVTFGALEKLVMGRIKSKSKNSLWIIDCLFKFLQYILPSPSRRRAGWSMSMEF